MALEHASTPYLAEHAQEFALDVPRHPWPKNGPAHPDLIESFITMADQASQAVALRGVQPYVDDGSYATPAEALAETWTQECCCSTLYRFEDRTALYDVDLGYVALSDGLARSITCYTWEYLQPHREAVIDIAPEKAPQLRYGKKEGPINGQAIDTRTAIDLISIMRLIRDDQLDTLHSVSRSFM